MLQHRYVKQEQLRRELGRNLESWETVHHQFGVRDDNDPDKLELWTKKHLAGARVKDLIEHIVTYYRPYVEAALCGEELSI